jgi:hypothetical protein
MQPPHTYDGTDIRKRGIQIASNNITLLSVLKVNRHVNALSHTRTYIFLHAPPSSGNKFHDLLKDIIINSWCLLKPTFTMPAGGTIVSTRNTKDFDAPLLGAGRHSAWNIIQVCKPITTVVVTWVRHIPLSNGTSQFNCYISLYC